MTARQLEDFIQVIETAEKLSSRRPDSSIWSYPTDIFTRTSSPRRITPRPTAPPDVPKLWDPKVSGDFLGSSWGSSGRNGTPTSSAVAPTTSSSSRTTVRTATKSVEATPSSTKSEHKTAKKAAKVVDVSDCRQALMNMQRHNRFARRQAKDLLSSMSPTNSPRPPRKSSSSRSPVVNKKFGGSKSPASRSPSVPKKSSPKKSTSSETDGDAVATSKSKGDSDPSPSRSPKKDSTSSSPKKESSSRKSSTGGGGVTPSPKKMSSSNASVFDEKEDEPFKPSPAKSKTLTRSVKILGESGDEKIQDLDDQDPRPIPQPRRLVSDEKSEKKKKFRPKSAPTPKKSAVETQQEQLVDLRSYSKSLKLLGLDIPSNRREATKVETHNVEIRTKSPTLRTRIKERTQSVTDLRQVVDSKHHLPKAEYGRIKANLANAVFEEWYFAKMQELAAKQRLEMEKIESKIYQKEVEEVEKKEKAAVEYKLWLERKQEQIKKLARRQKKKNEAGSEDKEARLAKIKAAEEEWKMKKAAEHKKKLRLRRRIQKKEEQEKLTSQQKREEALKHFVKWEQNLRQKMKNKMAEEKQKQIDVIEAKKLEAKNKREDAEKAFQAWKDKKNDEHHKMKSASKPEMNKVMEAEKEKKRLEEARTAYENWLEYIEQRDEEIKYAEEERALREMWRPPWYPAGIADY